MYYLVKDNKGREEWHDALCRPVFHIVKFDSMSSSTEGVWHTVTWTFHFEQNNRQNSLRVSSYKEPSEYNWLLKISSDQSSGDIIKSRDFNIFIYKREMKAMKNTCSTIARCSSFDHVNCVPRRPGVSARCRTWDGSSEEHIKLSRK